MHHQLGCKPVGLWHALTGFLHVPLNRAQLVSTATKYDQVVLETTSHLLKTQTLNFKKVFDNWKLHMSLEPTVAPMQHTDSQLPMGNHETVGIRPNTFQWMLYGVLYIEERLEETKKESP